MVVIIGIDILAGSSSQKGNERRRKFALAVLKDGSIVDSKDNVSVKELFRFCRRYEPKYLAVDNIFELATNTAKVVHFCRRLPLKTSVLQVTGAPPDGFETVKRLSRRYGIPYPAQHASPLETAEIIAKLAEKKVGYVLLPFEQESEIRITRARSIGPGGWSQQRYARRMRGEIRNLTREVEKQLQDHDIDYDLEVRKTEYGFDNAVFRAYTPLPKLRKVVSPFKGELSRITVEPIRKKRLEFIPVSGGRGRLGAGTRRKSNRGLIVGIDPGPNTGIAVMNFSGKILLVESMRSAARGDIIRKITLLGDPTLVAADVRPPPDFVVKIAKMLNAALYYPEQLLSSDKKKQIVNDYIADTMRVKGAHKRDALSAAIKAYKKYEELFDRINRELSGPNELKLRNKVKQSVIKEEMNIQDAIALARKEEEELQQKSDEEEESEEEEEPLTERGKVLKEKVRALKEMEKRQTRHIENLEDLNEEQFAALKNLRRKNNNLKRELRKITNKKRQELKRDRTIKAKDDELRFLRGKVASLTEELTKVKRIITDLKRMIVMNSNRVVVPMKVIYEFSRDGIEKTIERMNIEAYDVVLLLDPSGGGTKTAEMLIEREIQAVVCAKDNIADQAMEAFIKANIPVLFGMTIRQIDDIAVAFYDELEQAIADWEGQREKVLQDKTEEQLGVLIAEYQSQRRKELQKVYEIEKGRRKVQYKTTTSSPRVKEETKD